MNDHPKSNRLPIYPHQANSGSFCPSVTHPRFSPARELMICLGWMRLYQTILPIQKERGRVLVNEFLQIPDWPGVWAVGDCAFVPDVRQPGKSHPPTAQHAIREGRVAA